MRSRAQEIKKFILDHVEKHPRDIVAVTEARFKVTRMTVHRHLRTLLAAGLLFKTGRTNDTVYSTRSSFNKSLKFELSPSLSESDVWARFFDPLEKEMRPNVFKICMYGFTEIFNNAIDHSQGKHVWVGTERRKDRFTFRIFDDGVGIFKKIKTARGLGDEREAVLQLSKGKLTTDPSRHSGEGIFFSSRVFDSFLIWSDGLCYMRDNEEDDWFLESRKQTAKASTIVEMTIDLSSPRDIGAVFKKYENTETHAFDKTHILVNLSLSREDHFVSRSQAKRILANLENFNHVILDFRDIQSVGQAFVDEVFRVFKNRHPGITIESINANEDVEFMIRRGVATAAENRSSESGRS